MTEDERFWAKVEKTEDCWLWTGTRIRNGYGHFKASSKTLILAHRWAYQRLVGETPAGFEVAHTCGARECVRPDHLELARHMHGYGILYLAPEARFWPKVEKTETCWLWTGALNPDGYGSFEVNRATVNAHRWAYQNVVGPVPDGLVLDHLCRVRHCVNPSHLEPVTDRENLRRGTEFLKAAALAIGGDD